MTRCPGVLLVAALISIYFLCQSVKIWIMFPIIFLVGLCFNFSRSTTSVLRYKIESKRCYKISDVPAGMHLVVLLLYRNSQHWNSISSLCCHPTSLRLRVRVWRVWESAERGACGGVRSEVNITRWTWQLDHVPAPDRQGVCQGRLTNVTAFFKPLV